MTTAETFIANLNREAAKIGDLIAFVEKYKAFFNDSRWPSLGSHRLEIYCHDVKDAKAFARAIGGAWKKTRQTRNGLNSYDYEGTTPDGITIHLFDAEWITEEPLVL